MKIALASPPIATTIDEGLHHVQAAMVDAAKRGAALVCFPEAYLPGLRGQDFPIPHYNASEQQRVMLTVAGYARQHQLALIMGMEWLTSAGRHIAAVVFDANGQHLGQQLKCQLDPSEDAYYLPGSRRQVFTIGELCFGIAICHEGWRYPETVRWAARQGAHIVFHPQLTGSDVTGPTLTEWTAPGNPYYEKAMLCRSIENTIYFASVNYGVTYQESATSLVTPAGYLQARLPYGKPGVLVEEIDLKLATRLLANRFAPERYQA
jgi:predicted amidohydrolase